MRHTNLQRLDMNLLLVFDALMEERSVTRVAERMSLTQAGVSHALARLRDLLGDELFVRRKGTMEPTSHASALAAPVSAALTELNAALDPSTFEPSRSTGIFRLIATDYFATLVLPALVRRLEHDAPGIDLRIISNSIASIPAMLANNDIEFAVGIFKNRLSVALPSECEVSTLFTDKYVCVMRRGHPLTRGRLTKARYLEAKHILFSPTGSAEFGIERYLQPIGIHRRIGLILSHYLAAPLILQESDMVMTVPRRMAEFYRTQYSVHIARVPIHVPPAPVQLAWNARFSQHPAYKWLRSIVEEISSTLT